ncbi:hypothetical protein [Aestuariivirga sp.]|uniref:bestrophin-like domain n=1 Tax=Aestuariivirga sp. TaxID=2650926 RepID=UPI0039E66060
MLISLLLGIGFIAGTILLMLGVYWVTRRAAGESHDSHTRDLAGSVMTRVATLHGLILALVFAQEMVGYVQVRSISINEADAVADVYYDAGRYGGNSAKTIQDALYSYASLAVSPEWQQLGATGDLSQEAWNAWDKAYDQVLDLAPASPREASLRDHMLQQIHQISTARVARGNQDDESISGLFWLAAIAGVVFIAIAYHSYPPTRHNLAFIAILGAYTGIILFFIYAFSNPFSEPGALKPHAFEKLLLELSQSRSG